MAVLAWVALGLVTALLASAFRARKDGRHVVAVRHAIAVVGALAGGLVAVAADVGSIGDFFNLGTWLIALGGAVLALLLHQLAAARNGRHKDAMPEPRRWTAGRAGGESERLDRNW